MDNLTGYIQDTIAKLSEKYDLRFRSHRMRVSLGVAAGAVPSPQPTFSLPTAWPFLLCGIAFASDREDDRRIVSATLETDEVKFIAEPTKIGAFGWPQMGEQGSRLAPAVLTNQSRLNATIVRDRGVDPAETYPGAQQPSTIDIVLIGADLLEKGRPLDATR